MEKETGVQHTRMQIVGIQRTTLIDWPGKISCTVFTYGCNFRCPFCHNPELVTKPLNSGNLIDLKYIYDFLKTRRGKLDAVVITGGEPMLQSGLKDFIFNVRNLGFLVKLDTNGTMPDKTADFINKKLVDYWAMDIKNSADLYAKTTGINPDLENIKKSISLIRSSGVPHEFRTTFVPGFHSKVSAEGIGKFADGAKQFFIQNFSKGKTIDPNLRELKGFSSRELEEFRQILKKYVKNVEVR